MAAIVLAACISGTVGSAQAGTTKAAVLPTLTLPGNQNNTGLTQSLDPADNSLMGNYATQMINAGLVRLDYSSLKVVPDLATWTVSGGGTVYTFHIRNDARFSNGDPVSAADAAWSLSRSVRPAGTSGGYGSFLFPGIVGVQSFVKGKSATLSGVQVLDAHTLRITLTSPESYFLTSLAAPPGYVLDRLVLDGQPIDAMTSRCIDNVGAGPFEFACASPAADVSSFYSDTHHPGSLLVPNPHYYGPKPRIRVSLPVIPDLASAWRQLESGRLDVGYVTNANAARAPTRMVSIERVPWLVIVYLVPDLALPPFKSVACRLAVAYALDRGKIVRAVMQTATQGAPLFSALPRGLPDGGDGYLGSGSDLPSYNPARARAYLRDCPGGLGHLPIAYASGDSTAQAALTSVSSQLAAIGAHAVPLPSGTFGGSVNVQPGMAQSGTIMLVNSWWADYPDARDWLAYTLTSGKRQNPGEFSNQTFDRLVTEAGREPDPGRRAAEYRAANKLAIRLGAIIPLEQLAPAYAVNRRVHGIVDTPVGIRPIHGDWSRVSVTAPAEG
jgi:ABC-type transport system substrate-binding protein